MSWVHYPCSELLNTQQTLFLDHLFFWLFVNTAIWFYFNREKWILLIRASLFHCYNSKNEQILHFEKSLEHVFFHVFVLEVFPLPFFSSSFLASLLFLSLAAALSQLPPTFRPTFHSLETRLKQRQPPHSSGLLRFIPAYNAGADLKCCKTNCTNSVLFHARKTPADFLSHL